MSQSRRTVRGASSARALRRRLKRRGAYGNVQRMHKRTARSQLRMLAVLEAEGFSVE